MMGDEAEHLTERGIMELIEKSGVLEEEILDLRNKLSDANGTIYILRRELDEAEGNVDDAVTMLKDVSERLSRARLGSA